MRKTSSARRQRSKSANADQCNDVVTIAETNITYLVLEQLALSPTNVRKTPATEAEDAELEASIRAKGILHNLIVHWTGIDGKGVYLVDAGGRRLQILQKLPPKASLTPATTKSPARSNSRKTPSKPRLPKTPSAPPCTRPTNLSPWRR
jgi:hypothetical protein